ncbi:methionine aminopeptidase 1 [Arthrobacter sp. Hiyo8]|nr:methionine aminopeptidase 1 [Arthrobacter sp. Hiyo8]GAP58044.1 methionine aminopeptidase 1 [Arthrobacter sp. Hiyo1]
MSMVKTPEEIALMREAGRVVANTLSAVRSHAGVGVSLKELDEVAAAFMEAAGAKPAFLNYRPRWASTPFQGSSARASTTPWCTASRTGMCCRMAIC